MNEIINKAIKPSFMAGYLDEMVAFLRELIAIPSVEAAAEGNKPFGEAIDLVYSKMLNRAAEDGFEIYDADRYGGHIEWKGSPSTVNETLGIIVHLDVVPAGDGWSRDPFTGEIADGKLYGRGTIDDKGPTVAVYFAMKALKENGFLPCKNIRLILGLDEETNWIGMDKYIEAAGAPDFGFSPDANFPAINGEMGILVFELAYEIGNTNEAGLQLLSVSGGNAPNMVPDKANAVLLDSAGEGYSEIMKKLEMYCERTGYKVSGKVIGKELEITAQGVSAHGAYPWLGQNAISIMMDFLGELTLSNQKACDFLKFYNTHIGFENDGKGMGVNLRDEVSGTVIFNPGMIRTDDETIVLTINLRYPVTLTDEDVYRALSPSLEESAIKLIKIDHQAPIYIPAEDPFIQTLMDVYRDHTGDKVSSPIVIGGGTFARAIPNGVAFGMCFPDEEDLAHQTNENIDIERLICAADIYADAIKRLTE